jgi:hypothetical protein
MYVRTLARKLAVTLLYFGAAFAGEEKRTEVVKPAFTLSLPGEWSLISEPADDFWQYESKDGREGVSIKIYSRPGAPNKSQIRQDFDRFLAAQRRAEGNIEGTPLEVGETKITEEKGILYGLHAGMSRDGKHRTVTRIAMDQNIAISLFYEAQGIAEDESILRATDALFTLELKK